LSKLYKWKKNTPTKEAAYKAFCTALVLEFNAGFGTDTRDLNVWQGLCARVGINPLPDSITGCRKVCSQCTGSALALSDGGYIGQALRQTHVNLIDLVATLSTGRQVKTFKTVNSLRQYTISTKKFFPKDDAIAGNLLKYLLRGILT